MIRCFVVGCGKCGTTTLAAHLAAHPQVAFSSIKETNFFSDDKVRALGHGWYDSLFSIAPTHTVLAEASPSYSFLNTGSATAERIAST